MEEQTNKKLIPTDKKLVKALIKNSQKVITKIMKKEETNKTAEEVLTEVMTNSCYNADFRLSRPYIIEAMEEYAGQSKWVSVEERLPEDGEYVLAHYTNEFNGVPMIYVCSINDGVFYDDLSKVNVTHWQPLPTPPKN